MDGTSIMSALPIRYMLSDPPELRVKKMLIAAAEAPIRSGYSAFETGQDYYFEVGFDDFDILLEYESELEVDSNQPVKTLAKPRLVIVTEIVGSDKYHQPVMLVELMLVVNLRPHGSVYLKAYSQLCRLICDIQRNGGLWQQFGLQPHIDKVMQTSDRDGEVIGPEFKGRLLTCSVITTCSITGEAIR